jgi:hypothetical protein
MPMPSQMPMPRNPIATAGQAALAASSAAAVSALQAAAVNAAKPGGKTTEWKAVVGGVLLTGLFAGLKVLSVIPGPWTLPALAIGTGLSVGAYALSRGNVKVAALQAAAAAVATIPLPAPPAGIGSEDPTSVGGLPRQSL